MLPHRGAGVKPVASSVQAVPEDDGGHILNIPPLLWACFRRREMNPKPRNCNGTTMPQPLTFFLVYFSSRSLHGSRARVGGFFSNFLILWHSALAVLCVNVRFCAWEWRQSRNIISPKLTGGTIFGMRLATFLFVLDRLCSTCLPPPLFLYLYALSRS